jgi:hypothetical protein
MSTQDEFTRELRSFLGEVYPEFDADTLIAREAPSIRILGEIYENLSHIHANRDRYDLHWAFHETGEIHVRLTNEMERAVDDGLTSVLCDRDRHEIDLIEEHLRDVDRTRSWAILHSDRYFSTLSFAVSLLDIIISIILIVVISEIAHIGGDILDSVVLGILFIGIIALLKVSFDRFYILPFMKGWGWSRYLASITVSRKTMVKLKGITMALMASRDRHDESATVIAFIKRGIRKI